MPQSCRTRIPPSTRLVRAGDEKRGCGAVLASGVSHALTRTEVDRIARLAHLELTDTETERLTRELGDILTYFERLSEIDTTGVPATTHPVSAGPVMREDRARDSLPRNEVLSGAPDAGDDGLFRVPKVIG